MQTRRHAPISRRRFLEQVGVVAAAAALPAWARGGVHTDLTGLRPGSGTRFDLSIAHHPRRIDGRTGHAVLVNGELPAPLLRWREGDVVTLNVTNELNEDTSIHWHGILLPFQMDGVPGVSFPGIRPGETFTYQFPLVQSGTYWYHSHSGFQEQQGHYGPIIIEPRAEDPVAFDRELVIVLSDWTFEHPHRLYAKLKKLSHYYNRQQRTLGDFFDDVAEQGFREALADRMMWGAMRMNPADIADVTGATYTFLTNGHSPTENWQGLFSPGERVRLRFINASAMTIFNVRIPDLPVTIVQADGLNVQPIETDEFQIGVAETFDAIVRPADRPYTIMAESNDRSGYARSTLTPRPGEAAAVPALRPRPTLTMKDMAMDHDMSEGHDDMSGEHAAMDHGQSGHSMTHHAGMDHAAMGHSGMAPASSEQPQTHTHPTGPGVAG
ncbi:MAG TPA: copper resistance system multicopper oxidase, partial [Pseudomonadales bacterium]